MCDDFDLREDLLLVFFHVSRLCAREDLKHLQDSCVAQKGLKNVASPLRDFSRLASLDSKVAWLCERSEPAPSGRANRERSERLCKSFMRGVRARITTSLDSSPKDLSISFSFKSLTPLVLELFVIFEILVVWFIRVFLENVHIFLPKFHFV